MYEEVLWEKNSAVRGTVAHASTLFDVFAHTPCGGGTDEYHQPKPLTTPTLESHHNPNKPLVLESGTRIWYHLPYPPSHTFATPLFFYAFFFLAAMTLATARAGDFLRPRKPQRPRGRHRAALGGSHLRQPGRQGKGVFVLQICSRGAWVCVFGLFCPSRCGIGADI